jgi:hypothetical protein
MAISALVVKNLQDTEDFIDMSQTTTSLTQTNITIKNVEKEILTLLKKHQNNLDFLFEQIPDTLPLSFANIDLFISIKELQKDTNYYNLSDKNLPNNIDVDFNENINYTYDFFELTKDKNITNFRQIDSIVQDYIKLTQDSKILNIKDKFLFEDYNESNRYIFCDYTIDISSTKSKVNMIIEVKESQTKTVYFDFYSL